MRRKILRNILKKKYKRNDIADIWRKFQIKKYGGEECYEYIRKHPEHGKLT